MSASTSRKLSAEVLAHPDLVALVTLGKAVGEVSAEAVRQTAESAGISDQQLRALLALLSAEGVSVSVTAADIAVGGAVGTADGSARKRVAAATSTAKKVTSASAKKAAARGS